MDTEWTEQRLERLITDQIEESLSLEYKDARAIDRKPSVMVEISKDVSAMANGAGGTLIYGIGEDPKNKHLPGSLTPIERAAFSKEWLEQVIQNIRPRVEGLTIEPVPSAKTPGAVYYVISIPQSETAHQAADQRYYRRYNFAAVPMYDHEIRDVMNRRSTPRVEVEITVYLGKSRQKNRVFCRMRNLSQVMTEHAALTVKMPIFIDGKFASFPDGKMQKGDGDFAAWVLRPHGSKLLFPEAEIVWSYELVFKPISGWEGEMPASSDQIEYVAFAGSMPPLRGKFALADRIRIERLRD